MPCSLSPHLLLSPGILADYHALAPFHYRITPPPCITRILTIRYHPDSPNTNHPLQPSTLAAIALEALPALNCSLRRIALPNRYDGLNQRLAALLLNREMRTISRVIVHPLFRSLGLATRLVQHLLQTASTPYTEALATMAHLHPFFQIAGMTPYHRPRSPDAVRLLAALDQQNLTPHDLPTLTPTQLSPFLKQELLRFTKNKSAPLESQLTQAHHRLTSWPLYYLHQNNPLVTRDP